MVSAVRTLRPTIDPVLIGVDASRVTRSRRTGTENYSLHVLRELLRQDTRNRYRLYLRVPLPDSLLPLSERTETRVIRLPRLWTHVGLSREMLLAPPDVLFVPSHVLPIFRPARSVVVVYDVGHRFFPRAHRVGEWLYVEWAIRRHVRVANALITISEASKRDLVRLYGADPERIAVAYPAVDECFRPQGRAEIERARAKYRLPGRYVLHVGTVKPRKNLPRLVRAFATSGLPPDTYLVLAGRVGFGAAGLHRAVVEANIGERVRVLSYVDGGDLPGLYSGAACVAMPSLHEGFGMPALEALACGAPVVASGRSSLPEFVGDAGVLVDPLDITSIAAGLRRVLADTRLADDLRAAGPTRAQQFTWARTGRVTLDVLERVGRT
jgi:glycosyltransferase involved in cell wall biosynthesis